MTLLLYLKCRKDIHCRVLKQADKPSGLGGGDNGIKSEMYNRI